MKNITSDQIEELTEMTMHISRLMYHTVSDIPSVVTIPILLTLLCRKLNEETPEERERLIVKLMDSIEPMLRSYPYTNAKEATP